MGYVLKGLDVKQLSDVNESYLALSKKLSRAMIEKDLLVKSAILAVCRTGREKGAIITFAGGTCLSQAHGVIQRMSEDADFRVTLPVDVQNGSRSAQKKFLSELKHEIVSIMEAEGFPLVPDSLKGRNENRYIMGNFAYQSAFTRDAALRPEIKLEITAFDPITRADSLPLYSIVDRIRQQYGQPVHAGEPVSVVTIQDTVADKIVGYLRRTAADRAGEGRGDYDDRLVRHLYDTTAILSKCQDYETLRDDLRILLPHVVLRDRNTYGNQFADFHRDPIGVLQEELTHITDAVTSDRYQDFCASMIYGDIPDFSLVTENFRRLVNDTLFCDAQFSSRASARLEQAFHNGVIPRPYASDNATITGTVRTLVNDANMNAFALMEDENGKAFAVPVSDADRIRLVVGESAAFEVTDGSRHCAVVEPFPKNQMVAHAPDIELCTTTKSHPHDIDIN